MKIAFLPGSCIPFDGRTLHERPLGGIETAVIRLAEALNRAGHKVYVFSHRERPAVSTPLYLPYRAMSDLGEVDAVIGVRELLSIFTQIPCRARYFWTGDSYDQLQHIGLGDRRTLNRLSAFLAVSNWQADRICAVSGFPRNRTYVLRNGHASELFQGEEIRSPARLIFTSTPYRGLNHLVPIFEGIRARVPDCELHIFSGMKVYEGTTNSNEMERAFDPVFNRLRLMPGVTVHGNVLQAQLARELMKSKLMVYPNTFEETSCIAALEAMAAGCPIVTSRRGALPETVADGGILIDGDPGTTLYQTQFITTVENLLKDTRSWSELQSRALLRSRHTTWDVISQTFIERIRADIAVNAPSELSQMTS